MAATSRWSILNPSKDTLQRRERGSEHEQSFCCRTRHTSPRAPGRGGRRPRHPRRRAGALARLRSRRPRRYDLVIPSAYLEDEKILLLLDIIHSNAFQEKALAMGGYEMHETGNVIDQI